MQPIASGSIEPRRTCISAGRTPALCWAGDASVVGDILRGAGRQPGLWAQGISGDLPNSPAAHCQCRRQRIARQLLQAMEYWRDQRLAVDLVIVNERASSYVQDLQNALEAWCGRARHARRFRRT